MTFLDRSKAPPPGEIRAFSVPALQRDRLPNGLSLMTMRHGKLPIVTAELVFPAGGTEDPADRAGLSRLTIRLLESGTPTRTADEIASELEYLGVELHAETSWDAAVVRMTVPTERVDAAFALFADIVRNAAFPESEVRRLRAEQEAEILQRRKDPRALASDMAGRFLFDSSVPYSRPLVGTAATIASLGREDVAAFHRERFTPAGATLILAGDIEATAARELAQRWLGDWSGPAAAVRDFTPKPGYEAMGIYLVDRPGSVQSEIRIGHVGLDRAHPDYFPVLVMNEILGGAFTSRLNMSLREKHGFTYGAQSGYAFRRVAGPFLVQAAVATEVTSKAITEALREVKLLRDEGATPQEVADARDYLAGILPLQFQTTDQVASRLGEIAVYGLEDDYFARYRDRILAVTPEEVHRVARAHLHVDDLAIIVIGDANAVEGSLRELGIGTIHLDRAEGEAAPAAAPGA